MSALVKASMVGSVGIIPRGGASYAQPVDAVRHPARVGARLAETEARPGRATEIEAPPAARTRLASTVRPPAQPEESRWQGGSTAFLAQILAQESVPEVLEDTPLQRRAGYAAYGAASGSVAVLGPAGAGVGLRV